MTLMENASGKEGAEYEEEKIIARDVSALVYAGASLECGWHFRSILTTFLCVSLAGADTVRSCLFSMCSSH